MDKVTLRALMAKRVAGIPVMVIAAVLAGAILLVIYRRSKATDTSAADTSSDSTPTGDTGPDDSTQQPVFQAVTSVSTPPESDTDDGTNQTPTPPNQPTTPRPSTAPASKQGEPPLNHVVKGSRDNTPAELARLYYGTNSTDAINKIKAANDTTLPPYPVGSSVHIPEKYEPKYFDATAHIDTEYEIARRNNTTADKILALNPGMHFPVKAGTRVRVH